MPTFYASPFIWLQMFSTVLRLLLFFALISFAMLFLSPTKQSIVLLSPAMQFYRTSVKIFVPAITAFH
jgi:hypothetical protein